MNYHIEYQQKRKMREPFSFQNPITGYMKVSEVLLHLNKNVWCTQYQLINTEGIALEGNYFKCLDVAEKIGAEAYRFMSVHVTQYLIND